MLKEVFGDDAGYYQENMDGYVMHASQRGEARVEADGFISKQEWIGFFLWCNDQGVGEKRLAETEDKALVWLLDRKSATEATDGDAGGNTFEDKLQRLRDEQERVAREYAAKVQLGVRRNKWSYCLENMPPSLFLQFRVQAFNSVGASECSEPSQPLITPAAHVPVRMQAVLVSNVQPTSLDVRWVTPHHGGSKILGYRLYSQREDHQHKNGTTSWKVAFEAPDLATGANVRRLAAGRTYRFRVAAFNIVGEGDPSPPSTYFTLPRRVDYILQRTKQIMAEQPQVLEKAIAESKLIEDSILERE